MNKQILLTVFAICLSLLSFSQHLIQSKVLYHFLEQYPIEGVVVGLYDAQNNLVAVDVTDASGVFVFENCASGSYVCKATTDLPGADVNLRQAFLIWLYKLGFIQLNDIQLEAADVNESGVVAMDDVNFILTNYFVNNQPFPAGDWIFTEMNVTAGFKEGGGPIGGTKVGDVEGVFVPSGRDLTVIPSFENFGVYFSENNRTLSLPITLINSQEASTGYGLVIDYDPEMIEIVNVTPYSPSATFSVINNQIRLSSMNFDHQIVASELESLVEIEVRMLKEIRSDYVAFSLNKSSHVLDQNGKVNPNVTFGIPVIKAVIQPLAEAGVYPNPFSDQVKFTFDAPVDYSAEIKVYDAQGRMVNKMKTFLPEGRSEIELPLSELPNGWYQLVVTNTMKGEIIHKQRIVKNK
ncbi:MAG: hypothetical protein FD155_1920 [Bacteroidetes bacterium]|nr:MAG: hypothetical protein FD155_1920 [Bacteroidota bacterium]